EIVDPHLSKKDLYQGKLDLFEQVPGLNLNLAEALLSPTRTYAPIIKRITDKLGNSIHGIIHCTGGGLSKNLRFGINKRYVKNNLFEVPAIFKLIQETAKVPWKEMYTVFNMGHRIEIICPEENIQEVIDISNSFNIEAKQVGHVQDANGANQVDIQSNYGDFKYSI
ncbi:MAG: hypothetical protein KDD56_03975, partial [Bdellovibrionales bacterium]|nr:hypothetical protein [Bdellovibrionales bacterium]